MSQALEAAGMVEEALKELEIVVSIKREDAFLWFRLSEIQFSTGRLIAATESMMNATTKAPGDNFYRVRHAVLLVLANRFEDAIHTLRNQSDGQNSDQIEQTILGDLYSRMGCPRPASVAYRAAGELHHCDLETIRRIREKTGLHHQEL